MFISNLDYGYDCCRVREYTTALWRDAEHHRQWYIYVAYQLQYTEIVKKLEANVNSNTPDATSYSSQLQELTEQAAILIDHSPKEANWIANNNKT